MINSKNIGNAISALGTGLMGIGVLGSMSGITTPLTPEQLQALWWIGLAGFAIKCIGSAIEVLLKSDGPVGGPGSYTGILMIAILLGSLALHGCNASSLPIDSGTISYNPDGTISVSVGLKTVKLARNVVIKDTRGRVLHAAGDSFVTDSFGRVIQSGERFSNVGGIVRSTPKIETFRAYPPEGCRDLVEAQSRALEANLRNQAICESVNLPRGFRSAEDPLAEVVIVKPSLRERVRNVMMFRSPHYIRPVTDGGATPVTRALNKLACVCPDTGTPATSSQAEPPLAPPAPSNASILSEPGDDAIIAEVLANSQDETRALSPVVGDRVVVFGNNYPGTSAELHECVRDAKKNVLNLVKRLHVDPKNIRLILDRQCTAENYRKHVLWALDGAKNYFLFNDSCHAGGQTRAALFASGNLVRSYDGPDYVQARLKDAPKRSRAKARIDDLPGVVLAACDARQLSEESPQYGGAGTEAFWQSYRDGIKPSELRKRSNAWLQAHRFDQDPVFLGPDDPAVFTGNNRRLIFNSSHGAEDVNPATGQRVDLLVTWNMVAENRWDESTEVTFDWWYETLRKVAK